MIDLAKISDLALLLIDASFGFEMEIFEFINICQTHGIPKIMGVLTHLDQFKQANTLRKTKKRLKHRFWTEIYQGAKLFYLSGLKKDDYLKVEIHNLGRFISVMKTQNIEWRNNHPYILVDRIEDLTPRHIVDMNPKCDRSITFYGYIHGSHLKYHSDVHIIGVGDYTMDTISFMEDPCPLPFKYGIPGNPEGGHKIKKRGLNQKERLVYAPLSGLGGLIYDKDAIYIDLAGSHSHRKKLGEEDIDSKAERDFEKQNKIQELVKPLDSHLKDFTLSLFKESHPIRSDQIERDFFNYQNVDSIDQSRKDIDDPNDGQIAKIFDDDRDELIDNNLKMTEERLMANITNHLPNDGDVVNKIGAGTILMANEDEANDMIGGLFSIDSRYKTRKLDQKAFVNSNDDTTVFYFDPESPDDYDCSRLGYQDQEGVLNKYQTNYFMQNQSSTSTNKTASTTTSKTTRSETFISIIDWTLPRNKNILKNRIMKIISDPDCKSNSQADDIRDKELDVDSNASELTDKEFSDDDEHKSHEDSGHETQASDVDEDGEGEIMTDKEEQNLKKEPEKDNNQSEGAKTSTKREKRMESIREKKLKQKARFDALYDKDKTSFYNEMKDNLGEQSRLNKSVFADLDEEIRVKYEGYRPGMYVRMEIDGIPPEFITNFDPTYPIIIGGLLPNECSHGFIQARVKKHRWFERILKTRDPLILSVGWRRYQSLLVYSNEDHSGKNRMLKYTPKNGHCIANFYGPLCPQNSGLIGLQSLSENNKNFRISLTGVITNLDKSLEIVKKLKLVGEPIKIFKKTAFVQGLFNSDLEAAKFEGATVKTVSSIRGQIKKTLSSPPGAVRVTFEDQILMSDIVFLRAWTKVEIPKLFNQVCNLLLTPDERKNWVGMKTVGQLRFERGLKIQNKEDSVYKPIQRKPFKGNTLFIPDNLEKSLPFTERLKLLNTSLKKSSETKGFTEAAAPTSSSKDANRIDIILRSSFKKDSETNFDSNSPHFPAAETASNKRKHSKELDLAKAFKKVAIIEDENEIKINRLMKVAHYMHNQKLNKNRLAMVERVDRHRKEIAKIEAKQDANQRLIKKRVCKALDMMKAKREKSKSKKHGK